MVEIYGSRILITGGAGFIGANLTRRILGLKTDVHLILHPQTNVWRLRDLMDRLHIYWVDLLDAKKIYDIIQSIKPSIIFNLAMRGGHPKTSKERLQCLKSGLLITAHLLEASIGIGLERFVHIGSSLEYGFYNRPIKETDPLLPMTGRGLAKATASLLIDFYTRVYRIPTVILRPFSVYGPLEAKSRFIPTILLAALNHQEILLTAPGYRHDFIFVEDVVEACVRAIKSQIAPGEVFNIGTGIQWTNEEVATLVQELVGYSLSLRVGDYPATPSDTTCWVSDIKKAERYLSWRPVWELKEGLRFTLNWLRDYMHLYG